MSGWVYFVRVLARNEIGSGAISYWTDMPRAVSNLDFRQSKLCVVTCSYETTSNKIIQVDPHVVDLHVVVGLHARWVGGCSFLWFGCLKKLNQKGIIFYVHNDGLARGGTCTAPKPVLLSTCACPLKWRPQLNSRQWTSSLSRLRVAV